jgi:hypothetical protein
MMIENPPEWSRRRWEDNTKLGINKLGLEGMELLILAQDRDKYSNETGSSIYCGKFRD